MAIFLIYQTDQPKPIKAFFKLCIFHLISIKLGLGANEKYNDFEMARAVF